ncbi:MULTISPECIES: aspartate kinase [Bacillus cereus group]|uniref:Aspartokinase n=1 Tax=Bacillus thuringiensis TaxID=1428 RepID=A0A9X6WFU8_BACTU|nr:MULTISPECIES: aspartate kinase [Bacillus cereus group]PFJ25954.1 aspartate kinase [Bacillus thuringiensis]PGP11540.1 aspartate kinase [Bacillus cereus]
MEIIVQKFGGTSVATEEARKHCVSHIKRELANGKSVVVVVSAMGRKGDPYATDTLLSLLQGEVSKREKDLLLITGELISASVFCSILEKEGISSVVLTGGQAGIITNDTFGSSLIMDVLPQRVNAELKEGKVVVVPGFQGVTTTGEFTTLGRGGSDTTAAALAAGLEAEVVDIFTDVEGIMTADPRVVKDAKYLEKISYEDVAQMAWGGATVVHPRAVELAMKHEIPMRIRSTFSNSLGTKVTKKSISKREYDAKEVMISGVVSTNKIHRYTIGKKQNPELRNFQGIFNFLQESEINVDFINITKEAAYFTVTESDSVVLEQFLKVKKIQHEKEENVSKVSIVGNAMNGVPGVVATIIKTIEKEEIEVIQTSDSNTTIWLLINEKDEKKAVQALHRSFFK